jgi:membrane-associated protease RseP (regulator of RpoE activity)
MMDKFLVYDVLLLVIFVAFMTWFLYTRKHNLKREGLLYLYRTSLGIKLINIVGKKYKKTLTFFSYIAVGLGYVLMASMLWLFGRIVWIYIFQPAVVQQIRVPPIIPLIPYLPQAFKLDFLPPFYFTYWIVILAIIAITHEFAHGIFAKRYDVDTKTTGFGFFPWFLPVFLAAFVELNEEKMEKKSKFSQMSVLAAGTFANVLTAIFFFFVLWIFFASAYNPAGIQFDNYAYDIVNVSSISMVNGIMLNNPNYEELIELTNNESLNEIKVGTYEFLASKDFLVSQKDNKGLIIVYYSSPALKNEIGPIIRSIDGKNVGSLEKLSLVLNEYSPGDNIEVTYIDSEDLEKVKEITLEENPSMEERAWLGVAFQDRTRDGIMGVIYNVMVSFRHPNVYYEPNFDAAEFIYNMLWWLILISISVALVNMLPMGIFDGGRFFYLTVWGITKNEKLAKNAFVWITYFLLFLVVLLMVFWAIAIF